MDFSKTVVPTASVSHSKLDLSSTHITTGGFMRLCPVYYLHMIPGQHIKGVGNVLSRLAPVAVPTYGRCRLNMRAFFVPFRTVFPNFNDFIVDTVASNYSASSLVGGSPVVSVSTLLSFVTQVSRPLNPQNETDALIIRDNRYDLRVGETYYVYNYDIRYFVKLLKSLGYRIIPDDSQKDMVFSALPLLCLVKVYLDWYGNSAYANNDLYLRLQRLLKFNDPSSYLEVTNANLADIYNMTLRVTYDSGNDVYLNAWDNPVSPTNGNYSSHTINDISSMTQNSTLESQNYNFVNLLTNGTPMMRQANATNTTIGTDFIHQALKSLTDYMKRNQLSGAFAVDRFLARFGINLDSSKVDRSLYIGASSVDVNFGDVMQHTNTAPAGSPSNLGEYAGQGFGQGQLDFDFKADEFGMFIVLYSIIPVAHLYQGFDRNLLHIDKDSFYVPEYDNLGCAAISKGEVYVSKNSTFGLNDEYLGVFGFAPRYYEYKQKQDFVTGDIDSPFIMQGGDAWHLNRELSDDNFDGAVTNLVHSFAFTQSFDSGQYDRIFQYTETDRDKFYLVFNFAVEALSPCKSLFDTYKFDELGQQLTLDSGGAKVN